MFLENLRVRSFRNISELDFRFEKKLNIIHGENAQGKTSVLESIYYLALTKSFRMNSEKIALKYDEEFFDLEGKFVNDNQAPVKLRLFYSETDGKHVFYNEGKINKYSEIIGIVPVVLLSLEDLDISYGLPAKRRRFIDILLSQINPVYLKALQSYKKNLLNRNRVIKDIKEGYAKNDDLFPWDIQLSREGTVIIKNRNAFVGFLNERLSEYYDHISEGNEKIKTIYKSSVLNKTDAYNPETLESDYKYLLEQAHERDLDLQTTQFGPHRDDLEFIKDDHPLKSFGSQGENKTFLIALKFAESDYLRMHLYEKPILLLDDIFGELDNLRIKNLMKFVKEVGQTFITTTIRDKFSMIDSGDSQFLYMSKGKMSEA